MRPTSRMNMLSAMIALGAGMELPPAVAVTGTESSSRSAPTFRKPMGKRQPRNRPCQCGSGLKAKKCCVYEVTE